MRLRRHGLSYGLIAIFSIGRGGAMV